MTMRDSFDHQPEKHHAVSVVSRRDLLIRGGSVLAALALSDSSALTLPLAYCIGLSGGTAQAVTQTQIGTLTGKAREVALAQALVWAGVG